MNIYEPYTESKKEDTLLHLSLTYEDKLESVVFSRILPLLALIFVFIKFIITDTSNTAWITGAVVFILTSFAIILNAKTGIEINFKEGFIEVINIRILGKKKEIINLPDVDHIDIEIYNEPRISGAFYRLIMKNNKRIILLRISGFLNYDEERFIQLNQQIESLTHLQIKHDWKGLQA